MNRIASAVGAVAAGWLCMSGAPLSAAPDARSLPMQFEIWTEGPAQACGDNCRTWVSATGAITADTPRDFEAFAKTRKLAALRIALDSDGGSVLGALALGRAIRKLGMITTVGKTVDLSADRERRTRAQASPRAYCESMCAFVLLAGVERHVPAEARVMVHQIWLGDRRDDPTAAQLFGRGPRAGAARHRPARAIHGRDGRRHRSARDRAEDPAVGADAAAVARGTAQHEDRHRGGCAAGAEFGTAATAACRCRTARARWSTSEAGRSLAHAGRIQLGRKHPLTVEGEEIGSVRPELRLRRDRQGFRSSPITSSGASPSRQGAEALSEVEIVDRRAHRCRSRWCRRARRPLGGVRLGRDAAASRSSWSASFADARSRSLTVETVSEARATVIRIGNAGVARSFQQFAANCGQLRRSAARSASEPAPRGRGAAAVERLAPIALDGLLAAAAAVERLILARRLGPCAAAARQRRARALRQMRLQPPREQRLVSSVMQTMVRSSGGATSRCGSSVFGRWMRAASAGAVVHWLRGWPAAGPAGDAALRTAMRACVGGRPRSHASARPVAAACLRSGRSRRPRRRRSAASRRGAPCSRAPVRARRCRPICRPWAAAPFSLSILRTVSRSLRSSSAFEPTTWRAMIEDEAWPSAQAFTSWAKSVTVSPSILRSTVTVEPHSLEWAVARGVGLSSRPSRGMPPASSRMRRL